MDDTSPPGRGRPEPEPDAAAPAPPATAGGRQGASWPIEPDPDVTNLSGRQLWRFAAGRPVGVEVGGMRIAAEDARIAHLGIRRDAGGRPYPASFARSPETGEPLRPPDPAPEPDLLDLDTDSAVEIPLPNGVPTLARAGRPAALYLFQENLGAFEAWDGRAFSAMGRLPPSGPVDGDPAASPLAAGDPGIAYATGDALVAVPLPQLGPGLSHAVRAEPGLRFLATPCWSGAALWVLAERAGRLVLCRGAPGTAELAVQDLGQRASGRRFAGPWTNRLGDALWTGEAGFVACPAGSGTAAFVPWPDGFAPLVSEAPWRDRADVHHQLGLTGGRYHLAALSGAPALRGLDGPHLAAGGVTYCGSERFDVPWEAPAEALNLGAHAGSLLVPLLAKARDTVLLALDIPGPRAGFLGGARLAKPATGHVLHHAHGVGVRRLPVSLSVSAPQDAGALVHDRMLYLWSRSERRCHALRLRAA